MKCCRGRRDSATSSSEQEDTNRRSRGKKSRSADNLRAADDQCIDDEYCANISIRTTEIPYLWYPSLQNVKQIEYVRKLECEFTQLQKAFFSLTSHFARMQFRLRQIMLATPCEREALLQDLERLAFEGVCDSDVNDELPRIQNDLRCMGDVRRKQNIILERLRNQMTALAEASELEGVECECGAEKGSCSCSEELKQYIQHSQTQTSQQHSSCECPSVTDYSSTRGYCEELISESEAIAEAAAAAAAEAEAEAESEEALNFCTCDESKASSYNYDQKIAHVSSDSTHELEAKSSSSSCRQRNCKADPSRPCQCVERKPIIVVKSKDSGGEFRNG